MPDPGRPTVSAIVVFHDEVEYLGEAIASILAQSAPPLEILLVDSNATTECSELATDLAAAHPAIMRTVALEAATNGSLAAARRDGFRQARGQLIAFLDADDVWTPDKLERQVELLDRHPDAGFVYGRSLLWHSWDERSRAPDDFLPLGVEADRLVTWRELLPVLIENRVQTPTTCNVMVRREILARAFAQEGNFAMLFEDQELWVRLLAEAPAYVSSQCWARYRQRGRSLSTRRSADASLRERARLLRWTHGFLRERELADRGLDEQIRRARTRVRIARLHAAIAGLLGD